MVMCKYYAYKYPCLFEKKFGKCNSVHSSKVVEAHDYSERCLKEDKEPEV